jgi:hypothetical protein
MTERNQPSGRLPTGYSQAHLDARDELAHRLHGRPDVDWIILGFRTRGGRSYTDEKVIVVHVPEKIPEDHLAPDVVIPKQIVINGETVGVDVIATRGERPKIPAGPPRGYTQAFCDVQDELVRRFASNPNIHTFGLGKRTRGGVRTGERAVIVGVDRKLPEAVLPPASIIPKEMTMRGETIPIDVVRMGRPKLLPL